MGALLLALWPGHKQTTPLEIVLPEGAPIFLIARGLHAASYLPNMIRAHQSARCSSA